MNRQVVSGLLLSGALIATVSAALGASPTRESRSFEAYSTSSDVLVRDANASGGEGTAAHATGFRPAKRGDAASSELYDSAGRPLSLTYGRWRAASGTASFEQGSSTLRVRFSNLVPFGVYSLALVDQDGGTRGAVHPLPLDGNAPTFTASVDGFADEQATLIGARSGEALALIYHSGDGAVGLDEAALGQSAYEQLALALPADVVQTDATPPADATPLPGETPATGETAPPNPDGTPIPDDAQATPVPATPPPAPNATDTPPGAVGPSDDELDYGTPPPATPPAEPAPGASSAPGGDGPEFGDDPNHPGDPPAHGTSRETPDPTHASEPTF